MTQPLFANWATLPALNVPSLQHEEHKWAILCNHSQSTLIFPSTPPLTTPWCRQGTTPACPHIIFTDPLNQITCKGEARPQHDTIHQQSDFFEKRAFQNVCESSPIEAVLARLQHPWAAFVLCPHWDKHQCIHLNVLEQNTEISATNFSAFRLHECPKYFSPICPTLLHNAAINYAHIKGLQWNHFRNKCTWSLFILWTSWNHFSEAKIWFLTLYFWNKAWCSLAFSEQC